MPRTSRRMKAFLHGMYVGSTGSTRGMRKINRAVQTRRTVEDSLQNADMTVRRVMQRSKPLSLR